MSSIARDRIAAEVFKSNSATLIYDVEGGESPLMARPGYVADRIIAIVREALLSEEALYIACDALTLGSRDVYAREMAGRVVALAWQAAFGADDDVDSDLTLAYMKGYQDAVDKIGGDE